MSLFLIGGFLALTVISLAAVSMLQAKSQNRPWHEPLTELAAKVPGWFLDTPEREAIRAQRELWRAEDHEHTEAMRLAGGPIMRKGLLEEHQKRLNQRAKDAVRLRGYTVGSVVAFFICLLALVPIQAGSYYLKVQTARAFLVGSRNLMGLKVTIFGFPLVLHTVEVVTVGLMLLEIIAGVVLSHAHDRSRQINGEEQPGESDGRYVIMSRISWVMIIVLILTEAAMGFWRGSMEQAGSAFAMILMLVLSATIPGMSILVSYVLKGLLTQVAGPLGYFLRVMALAVFTLLVGPSALIAWLGLVVLGLVFPGMTNAGTQTDRDR